MLVGNKIDKVFPLLIFVSLALSWELSPRGVCNSRFLKTRFESKRTLTWQLQSANNFVSTLTGVKKLSCVCFACCDPRTSEKWAGTRVWSLLVNTTCYSLRPVQRPRRECSALSRSLLKRFVSLTPKDSVCKSTRTASPQFDMSGACINVYLTLKIIFVEMLFLNWLLA